MASCVADIQERFARQNAETANQNAEIANQAVAKYIADEAAKAQLTQGATQAGATQATQAGATQATQGATQATQGATQATQGKYGASIEFPPNELPGYTA
jgi:hypothetical protein